MTEPDAVLAHLPLRPVEYQILVGLSGGPRHGYAILQETEGRGDGAAVPGLATLYRGIRRLEEAGLLEPAPDADAREAEERRRHVRLTRLGRRVVAAETRRLATMVRTAQVALGETSGG